MSGAIDIRLRVLQDAEWRNVKVASAVHVSMYGKLNNGLRVPLMDLPPLLAAVITECPMMDWSTELRAYDPPEVSGFNEPGTHSGLRDAIEAARAMEVLSS